MSKSFGIPIAAALSLALSVTSAVGQQLPGTTANSLIVLSDSDIDSISNVDTLRHLLKGYSAQVRSDDGRQQQALAALKAEQIRTEKSILIGAMGAASVADILLDQETAGDKAADQLAEAQTECRNLSTLQTAVNGGLALKPAPYGQTYLTIFGFLTPFLFKNCTTGTVFTPAPVTDETKHQVRAYFATFKSQFDEL